MLYSQAHRFIEIFVFVSVYGAIDMVKSVTSLDGFGHYAEWIGFATMRYFDFCIMQSVFSLAVAG